MPKKNRMRFYKIGLLLIAFLGIQLQAQETPTAQEATTQKMAELVMVFTKTMGYRHASMEKGVQT